MTTARVVCAAVAALAAAAAPAFAAAAGPMSAALAQPGTGPQTPAQAPPNPLASPQAQSQSQSQSPSPSQSPAPTQTPLQPPSYVLDPDHSFVYFEVLHFGTSTLRGRFGPLQGLVTFDPEHQRGEVGVRVAAASVSTGLRVLDARLREADLLASDANPEIFFVARNFRFAGRDLLEVRGEFTLRGQSQPLSLRTLTFGCRDDVVRRRQVCGGTFEGFFNRGEFGLDFGLPLVANRVRLLVDVEGVRR